MMKAKINPGLMIANMVVIGLAAMSYIGLTSIQLLYPLNNMATDDRTPTFEWSGYRDSYELLIDDDPAFSSPLTFHATGNIYSVENELEFGTYWWKVRSGEVESEPKRFSLLSTVALSRPVTGMIVNSGNTELLVHRGGLTGAFTLAVNQTLEIEERENVKAEQK